VSGVIRCLPALGLRTEMEEGNMNSGIMSLLAGLITLLLTAGCAHRDATVGETVADIGLRLGKTAVVVAEDVLPHLARTEAADFASQASRHWGRWRSILLTKLLLPWPRS
jgi:hypothetical protein